MLLLAPILLFLPGLSWILCSGLNKQLRAVEKLALSLIISIIFDSLFTAALSLVTSQYLGYSAAGSILVSLIFLLVWLLRYRPSLRSLRPRFHLENKMLPVTIAVVAYVIIVLLLGWSTPVYPSTDAFDPVTHGEIVDNIIHGAAKTLLLHTSIPIGLHFASALLAYVLEFNGLGAMRILLSVCLIDSILLTYFCARTILNEVSASFVTLVAGFVIPVDAMHLIQIGTFPNMMSDAIVLAALWLAFAYVKNPNRAKGLTLSFLVVGGLFVHSTFLLFLVSLWVALPVFVLHFRVFAWNYFKALLFTIGGILVLVVVLGPFLTGSVERVLFGSYGTGSTAPSTPLLLSLQNIAWNYRSFAGPLAPWLILLSIIFALLKRRNSMGTVFSCIWLGVLTIAMVISTESWRFILLSLVPGSFLIGDLLGALSRFNYSPARKNEFKLLKLLAPILLLVLVMSGGFIPLLSRIYSPTERSMQQTIILSMSWLQENDQSYGVASVGLTSSYQYLQPLTGLHYLGDYSENASSIIAASAEKGFRYVAVAVQSPQFPTFECSSGVQEKYRNSIVAIFFIP